MIAEPTKSKGTNRHWWALPFWAAGHWLALELVRLAMEIIAHLPLIGPHSDPAVMFFMGIERVLVFPRVLLRWLWFSESTPPWLLPGLGLLNSLIWGAAIQGWFLWRRRRSERER